MAVMPWKIKPAFRPAFSMEMPEAFKQPLAGVPVNCFLTVSLPPQRGKAVHAVHATNSVIMSTHRQGTHTDCLQHPPAIKAIKLLQSCSRDSSTHSLTLRVSEKIFQFLKKNPLLSVNMFVPTCEYSHLFSFPKPSHLPPQT